MAGEEPPYLAVGTDVSAKYKGAFCEAKVKKVIRSVKCKITFKNNMGSITVPDDQIKGTLRVNAQVEVRHPEKNQFFEAVINKLHDQSRYTVVFDDGDETTLRRTSLCLKSGRHFAESETLDQLPLTHPEHFGTPVMGSKGRKRRSLNRDDNSSDEETPPPKKKEVKLREPDPNIGKVVCVEMGEKRKSKDNWFPALVVSPSAQESVKIARKEEYLVRSFKDGKYYCICKKDVREFTREIGAKVDNNTLKTAVEKAQAYNDRDELPPHWDRDVLFRKESTSDEGDSNEETDSDTSDDEPSEDKDRFVAQLYKFMDDRGTPINKAPTVANRDLNLYKLFKVVQKLGGYNRVTNHMQWKIVYTKMGLPSYNSSSSHHIKQAYKKYLHSFEDFYRKLGSTMGTNTRAGRMRHRTGRMLTRDRDREFRATGSRKKEAKQEAKQESKVKKEEADEEKTKEEESEKKSEEEEEKKVKPKKVNKKVEADKGPKVKGRKKASRDDESEEKTHDTTDDDDTYSDVDINVGDKVRVKYGRGRHQKIYEAKVLELEIENGEKNFYVHYTGWNMRYDEWVNRQRIVENLSLKVRKGRSAGSPKMMGNKVPAKRGRPPIGAGKNSASSPKKSNSGQSRSRTTRSDKNSLTDSPFVNGLEPQRRSRNKSGPQTPPDEAGGSESDETDDGFSQELKKEKSDDGKQESDNEKEDESAELEECSIEEPVAEKSDEEMDNNKKKRGRKKIKKKLDEIEEESEVVEEEKPPIEEEREEDNEKETSIEETESREEESEIIEEKSVVEMEFKEEPKPQLDEETRSPEPIPPVESEPEVDSDEKLTQDSIEDEKDTLSEPIICKEEEETEDSEEKELECKSELIIPTLVAEEHIDSKEEVDEIASPAVKEVEELESNEFPSSELISKDEIEELEEEVEEEDEEIGEQIAEIVEKETTDSDVIDAGCLTLSSSTSDEEQQKPVESPITIEIPQEVTTKVEEGEIIKKEKDSKKKLEKSDEVKKKNKDKEGKAKKSREKKKLKRDETGKKKENKKRKDEDSSEGGEKKKKNRKNKQGDSVKKKSKKKLDKGSDEDSKKSSRKSGKRKKKKWSSGDEQDNGKNRKNEKRLEPEKVEEIIPKKDENEDLMTRLLCREDVPLSPVLEVGPSEGHSSHYDMRPMLPLSFSSSTGSASSTCSFKDNARSTYQKEPSTVLDNTPPTTPESQDSVLSILNDAETSPDEKSNSYVEMECYVQERAEFSQSEAAMVLGSMGVTNYEKNPVEVEVSSTKRSCNYEDESMPAKKRKRNRRQSHSISEMNKVRKGNRNGTSDSDEAHSEPAAHYQTVMSSNSNDSSYIAAETEITSTLITPRSPRQSKFNFFVELDDYSDGSQRIAIIQEKLSELKKTYMALKAEVACIDRRRKKLRRKEKEASAMVTSASQVECS